MSLLVPIIIRIWAKPPNRKSGVKARISSVSSQLNTKPMIKPAEMLARLMIIVARRAPVACGGGKRTPVVN